MDLWLVDSTLCVGKVNLGFLIVQHMTNVLASAHSVHPYDMLLTTIFQYIGIDLDGETDICICKPSYAIDNGFISRLGYELERNQLVSNTSCVHDADKGESDEKAAWIFHLPPSLMFLHPLLALVLLLLRSIMTVLFRTSLSVLTPYPLMFSKCTLTIKRICVHSLATSTTIKKHKIGDTRSL